MSIYGTLADAQTYHDERSNIGWTDDFDDVAKSAALLRATEYIDAAYASRFPGEKTGFRAQIREWPRSGAYDNYGYSIDSNEIPAEVENATYEAALRELVTPGSLNPDYDPEEQLTDAKLGPLSVSFAAPTGQKSVRPIYPNIGMAIQNVLTGSITSSLSANSVRV